MQFKYKINHLLSLLPAGVYPETIIAQLEFTYQVSSKIFFNDRYILIDQEDEIPFDRLSIYAQIFGVGVEDLMTRKPALTKF